MNNMAEEPSSILQPLHKWASSSFWVLSGNFRDLNVSNKIKFKEV